MIFVSGAQPMARPREFDRVRVLDLAVEVFWQRGYEGTSIQDLVDRMGIHRGSLYCAFGGKHQLFLAALDRYEEVFHSKILERLAEGSQRGKARRAIRQVFEDVVGRCASHAGRKGCMMTNSAVELAPHDRDTAARVSANHSRLEEAFCTAVRTAQADNEISRRYDARALARFLASSLQGLRVTGMSCPDGTVLRDAARVTLSALD
jgi:TetR/AcrR family transcriptional regulator, transcriptional repressor for nem operon